MFETTDVVLAETLRRNEDRFADALSVFTGMCYRLGLAAQTVGEAAEKVAHSASVIALAYTASVAAGEDAMHGDEGVISRRRSPWADREKAPPDPSEPAAPDPWKGIAPRDRARFVGLPGYPEKV
jgi:hypothetical protein